MSIQAEQSDYNILSAAIDDASHIYEPMRDRSEIISYYQDTYGADWKKQIVDTIVAQTGGKRASVSREFQYDKRLGTERYNSPKISGKTREKYTDLGKGLPGKKVPKNVAGKRATISFQGKIWISKKAYNKSFSRELTEQQTAEMLEGQFDPMIEAYGINPMDVEEMQIDALTIDI